MTSTSNNQVLTKAYHDFFRGLSRYAYLKVRNPALGEDLVQTTFMKTWLYLKRSGKVTLMRAFLYHVLNRLIIDEYRRKKSLSLDLLAEEGFEPEAVHSENIFDVIDEKALALLVKKLPEKYRNVITMRYMKDLSLKEISALTNQSRNTISVQVHRGLVKLRELYAESVA